MSRNGSRRPSLSAVVESQRLWAGWARTAAGSTMPGFDGVTPGGFAARAQSELKRLAREVLEGSYAPAPLRTYQRVVGDKPRVFGVSAVRDRVLQQAARAALRPWLDDRQADSSFAYLRGRGWLDALREVEQARREGLRHVYRFDIRDYFESIDHRLLMEMLADDLGVAEPAELLMSWAGCPRVRGNYVRPSTRGLALGMPIAPTLANHFLRGFDRAVGAHAGRLVRYADDAVVLCPSRMEAEAAGAVVAELLGALGLEPNRAKSGRTSFDDGFRFLGFRFLGDAATPEHGSQFEAPRR